MSILTRKLTGVLLALGFLFAHAPVARAETEYEVKAVFLFNFSQFISWPAKRLPEAEKPFVIGILGDDPFGAALDQSVKDETVNNHKIVVKRSKRLEDLQDCHILFVSRSEKPRLTQVLASTQGTGTLTVGETEQFARQGGVINFVTTRDNKVRFEINVEAAAREGLKLNAKLLKVAKLIGPEER